MTDWKSFLWIISHQLICGKDSDYDARYTFFPLQTNLIFGWKLCSYKTLSDSAETMVSLQLGIFNYEEVLPLDFEKFITV